MKGAQSAGHDDSVAMPGPQLLGQGARLAGFGVAAAGPGAARAGAALQGAEKTAADEERGHGHTENDDSELNIHGNSLPGAP